MTKSADSRRKDLSRNYKSSGIGTKIEEELFCAPRLVREEGLRDDYWFT